MYLDLTEPHGLTAPEVGAVADLLSRRKARCTVLEIAHATSLSTLVVVPALDHLLAVGTVARHVETTDGRARSAYQLTATGRRLHRPRRADTPVGAEAEVDAVELDAVGAAR